MKRLEELGKKKDRKEKKNQLHQFAQSDPYITVRERERESEREM